MEGGSEAGAPRLRSKDAPALPRPPRRRRFSPLTRRILFVNMLALAIPVAGLLYLDDYRNNLLDAEFAALKREGSVIAGALASATVEEVKEATGEEEDELPVETLAPEQVRMILSRLVDATHTRARVFDRDGMLIADTRNLYGSGLIETEPLPPPQQISRGAALLNAVYDRVVGLFPRRKDLPPYVETPAQVADDYEEVPRAQRGEVATALRRIDRDYLMFGVGQPIQRFRQVLGVLYLTADSRDIERTIRELRFDILRVFAVALAITILMSLYLAGTIARPIRRLALAADRVRHGVGGRGRGLGAAARSLAGLPDLSRRGDEIGDLSESLRDMTQALSRRLDAIERFAADVAHEIKNPLTSLKSAVETATRLKDPEQQRKLLAIVADDVMRIDRLLSDISSASRLDAELSRAEIEHVDVGRLLAAMIDLYETTRATDGPRLAFDAGPAALRDRGLVVPGLEGRLGQVFRNIIANAESFSPPGSTIRLAARRAGSFAEITIDDEGPGIPEDTLERIFDRFYSERPKGEKFGTHSGLGLSISKQIVEAHGGTIRAENRHDAQGKVIGARFVVMLPLD